MTILRTDLSTKLLTDILTQKRKVKVYKTTTRDIDPNDPNIYDPQRKKKTRARKGK